MNPYSRGVAVLGVILSAGLAVRAEAAATATTGLPAKAPYWLKAYSIAPYQETWSATLTVKNLDRGLPKIVKAISVEGGALTQDLRTFISSKSGHTQQLIATVPRGRVRELLKQWRRLGELPEPEVSTTGARVPADEVRAKIDRLTKERVEHADELAKLPVAREIEDEVLEHLLLLEDVARGENDSVRVDLLVRQR